MYLPRSAVVTDARVAGRGDAGYGNSVYFTTDDGGDPSVCAYAETYSSCDRSVL